MKLYLLYNRWKYRKLLEFYKAVFFLYFIKTELNNLQEEQN